MLHGRSPGSWFVSHIIISLLLCRCDPVLHQGLRVALGSGRFLVRTTFALDEQAKHPSPDAESLICRAESKLLVVIRLDVDRFVWPYRPIVMIFRCMSVRRNVIERDIFMIVIAFFFNEQGSTVVDSSQSPTVAADSAFFAKCPAFHQKRMRGPNFCQEYRDFEIV